MGAFMTTARRLDQTGADTTRPVMLVWIDAAEAVIVRLRGSHAELERVESEVPAHHRATGHIRHDPGVRHGGGGSPQTAGEPHRIQHLKRFVTEIANRLPPGDDLLILGPGNVHERLKRHVSESDERHGRQRDIACEVSPRLTDRQLVARLRRLAGVEPRRRTVGAYRWSLPPTQRASGQPDLAPHRVVNKLPRNAGQEAPGDSG
jgi:hypothetical protein